MYYLIKHFKIHNLEKIQAMPYRTIKTNIAYTELYCKSTEIPIVLLVKKICIQIKVWVSFFFFF